MKPKRYPHLCPYCLGAARKVVALPGGGFDSWECPECKRGWVSGENSLEHVLLSLLMAVNVASLLPVVLVFWVVCSLFPEFEKENS